MDPLHELQVTLTSWLRWYRMRRAVTWAVRGLAAGLALFILVVWSTFLNSLLPRETFLRLLPLLAFGGVAVAAIGAYFWPLSRIQAARRFDRLFGLRERVSTALELASQAPAEPGTQFAVLKQQQLADALLHARQVRASRHLPVRFNKMENFLVIVLLGAVAATWWRAEPYFTAARQAQLLQQSITQEQAKIDTLRQQIVQDPDLTPEQRAALTKPLGQALRELQNAQTPEQAVAALEDAAGKLQALSDPKAVQQAQALQEAGQNLSQQAASSLQSFSQDLANGKFQDAAQKLQNLDPKNMTPEEQQAVASQLASSSNNLASNNLAQSNPQLAQQLQQAASALRNGDTQNAQQAMQNAAHTLAQAGAQLSQSHLASQAAAQLTQAQQSIAQAQTAGQAQGQSAQGNAASGQTQAPGAGQQAGSSTGQGQSGASGTIAQNNGAGGGGAGRGQGSGDIGPGPEAGTAPIGQGNGPGDGGESPYEPIYAPQHLGGGGGQDVALPGSGKPGEQVIGQGNSQAGQPGQSQVPYIDVYPSYANAYRQAIESGQVPPQLRNLVKQYFSSLAP